MENTFVPKLDPIDNGQLTMDNFGRVETVYTIEALVPDCIIIDLLFFAINRRGAPMCAPYL